MGDCLLYLIFADEDFTKATFNIFQCERITFSFLIIQRKIMATIGACVVSPHPSLFQLKVQIKCFFLFPNVEEQQKSGRSPFTVS